MKNPKIHNGGLIIPVRYLRTVKMVWVQFRYFEGIKDLLRFKSYCSFPKNIRYIATPLFLLSLENCIYVKIAAKTHQWMQQKIYM